MRMCGNCAESPITAALRPSPPPFCPFPPRHVPCAPILLSSSTIFFSGLRLRMKRSTSGERQLSGSRASSTCDLSDLIGFDCGMTEM